MDTQDDGFNDIFGPIPKNTPTPESKSFMDEIASYARPSAGSLASFGAGPEVEKTVPGFEYAKGADGGFAGRVATDVSQAVQHPVEALKGVAKGIPGQAAGFTELVEKPGKAIFNKLAEATGQAPLSGLDYGPIQELTAPSNPAQEAGYVASGFLPVEKAISAGKPLVEAGLEAAKPFVTKGTEMVGKGADVVGDVAGAVKKKLTPSFGVKTPEEIMATPADANALKKLTDAQREHYFKTKFAEADDVEKAHLEAVNKEVEALRARETADMAKKAETASKEVTDASKNLDKASYEEVQSLKPKLADTIRKNGDVYTDLIDKAMPEEVRNQMVTRNEIASQINSKVNSMDPASVADAQQKIAFINEHLPESGATVGDLYDAMKSIRKENISKTATRGKRVYSGDEYQALNTISEISNFLKSKGVDLSEANSFWAKNAEARDRLISSIQPYTTAGYETGAIKTFRENLIKRVSGEATPEAESFLKNFEEYTGTQLGNEKTMQAFNKLTEAQKNQLALKAEEAVRKATIEELNAHGVDAAKKSASELKAEIDKLKLTTAQKVAFRSRIQKAVGYALGGLGLKQAYDIIKD